MTNLARNHLFEIFQGMHAANCHGTVEDTYNCYLFI